MFKTAHAVSKDKSLPVFNEKLFSAISTGVKISVCVVCVGTSWGHACYVPGTGTGMHIPVPVSNMKPPFIQK
jgi:hypothetical protein